MTMKLRLLGHSGLRVSEFALGTMTFGPDWGWGADKATARAIFDTYVEAGGNFIDVANNYTNGTAEAYIGEFVAHARDRYVVTTKYTLRNNAGDTANVNLGGNSRKSMMRSVENSLRNMNTDYIDVLFLHMWDYVTPIEEVMRGVDDLVRSGKVLYFAFSDTPAWVIAYAVGKAEQYGWPRPLAMQFPYNLLNRAAERAALPFGRAFNMAMMPWGILASGVLTGKHIADETAGEDSRVRKISERQRAAATAVMQVAEEVGKPASQVAINWVRQQPGNIIPLLGSRKVAQLEDNLGALTFSLTDEQVQRLSASVEFDLGYPEEFLNGDGIRALAFGDTFERLERR